MLMKLKGAFLALSVFVVVEIFLSKSVQAQCKEGEKRMTDTEAIFTCDTSHASLGEAWRDPDGLIWGDVVSKTDGTVHYMNHNEAISYCASIGAHLPNNAEFTRLREYMGAHPGTHEGYYPYPQVLPNLYDQFWSSSVDPLKPKRVAYRFDGSDGRIFPYHRYSYSAVVRCVVDR